MTDLLGRLRGLVLDALEGESQEALAERLGVTQATISRWQGQGGPEPKATALEAVVRKLGVNGHWLLTGIGDKRVLSAGGDAVFAAGEQWGLQRAEKVVRGLRTTSTGADDEGDRARHVAEGKKLYEVSKQHQAAAHQPPRRGRRRKSGG